MHSQTLSREVAAIMEREVLGVEGLATQDYTVSAL